MNALILDDDILDLEGMKILVDWERLGIRQVFCASSTAQARRIVQSETVDVALCDIELPEESGLDFVQWMADQEVGAVVIFVTSHAKFDYASRALKLRARDYLLKPVSGEALESSLTNAIAYRRLLDAQRRESQQTSDLPTDEDEVVAQTKAYIQEHLGENISRADIAKRVYLHPDYLSHIFRDRTGATLSDYILQERVRRAKELLKAGQMSITEIGEEVGFSNASYFGKMFRKCTGCTPKDYRGQYKKERGGL